MTVGRPDGRTVGAALALAVLSVSPAVRLAAQISWSLAAGARYTTTMVHDSIVTPLDVRPALAPAFTLAAATPLQPGWSGEALLDVSWSALERHDQGGLTTGLGNVTTLAVAIGVRREFPAGLSARLAMGALKYFPASETGIFRQGSGGLFPLGGAAVAYGPPLAAARRWHVEVEARYDVHKFITPALRTQGFSGARLVHRVALALKTGWPHGGEAAP